MAVTFGSANSNPALFTGPALSALETLAGGKDQAQQALALTAALTPKLQEFDPYIAAMKYFTGMTAAASKPGATVFGSAAQAFASPVAYLQEVNQVNRKIKASVPQTAISIAQALKPPKTAAGSLTSEFYGVQKKNDDGSVTDVVETPLTPAELQALKADPTIIITRVEPSSTSKFTPRDVFKDGKKKKVYTQEKYNTATGTGADGGWTDQSPISTSKFTARDVFKDGKKKKVYTQADYDTATGTGSDGGWTDQSPISTSKFTARDVFKDGKKKKVYTQADYDTATGTGVNGGWSDIEPATQAKPPPSADERYSKTVFDFVDLFVATPDKISSRNYGDFLDAVKSISEVKIITFKDDTGATRTISSPGKDAYKLIAEAYGPEVATAIRKLNKASEVVPEAVVSKQTVEDVSTKIAPDDVLNINLGNYIEGDNTYKVNKNGSLIIAGLPPIDVANMTASDVERKILEILKLGDPTSTASVSIETGAVETVVVDDENKDEPKDVTETFKIGDQTFTLLSETANKIPKEAVQGLVDSTAGMVDVKIAFDIIFKGGKLNRKTVAAANLMPGGGVGPEGSITGDARTAYQAMKRSIELLLRARSGAAVPPAEVENYMSLYFPATLDNDAQARGKLARLAQYFADTNRLLSLGNASGSDTFSGNITPQSSANETGGDEEGVVTITSEWTLNGIKYKQLSNGQIISEEAD